jgi:outer membrane protein assembly factor BamD
MRYPLCMLLFGLLVACASDKADDAIEEKPPEVLYNDAKAALDNGKYETAVKGFEEVQRQHPYSPWSTRAEILAAFAQYENSQYDDAVVNLDRFIELHPTHPDVSYAWYLKALCAYEQITDVGRDQAATVDALDRLEQVIRRFPETEYARDAKLKLDLAKDHLAGKEMEVGRFYAKNREWLGAINRYRSVVDTYQTTTHVQEALYRLTESYLALGLHDEAVRNAAVLGHNYPGSQWYEDAYTLLQQQGISPNP